MGDKSVLVMVWLGLLVCAWPLDRLVENFVIKLPPKSLLRATDTAVHGLIGGLSYWMACIICPNLVINPFILLPYFEFSFGRINKNEASKLSLGYSVFFSFCVAFMISSCIDLDHIVKIAIKHTNFHSSTAFWRRGYLHLSLPPLVLSFILYLSSFLFHSVSCVICATLCILSILSHHIRDGVHHGLDFYPVGTTPILPYWLYLVLTLILPVITSHISSAVIHFVKYSLQQPIPNVYLV